MEQGSRPPTDLRRQHRQTERRLAVAVVLSFLLLGGGLVGLIYGRGAGILAVSCLAVGCALFGALWLILIGMERWAARE